MNDHIHLFTVPTSFERLIAPDAVDNESYFVRNLTAMTEFDLREQETYIDDCFKDRRTNVFSVLSVENFDLVYSFCHALAPASGQSGDYVAQVTKSARGLLAQHLANTFLTIQNAAIREGKRYGEDREKHFGVGRPSFETVASLLRGATNMCMTLLHRVMTAPVHHRDETAAAGGDGGGALSQLSQNAASEEAGTGKHKKKKRLTKKQQALEQAKNDEDDGVTIEVIENVLRGCCEMMSVEASAVWSQRPIPIRDPETGDVLNEVQLTKNVDGMPDNQTVLKAMQIAMHHLSQKRTYIGEATGQNNPLGRGIIDTVRVLGRCVALRYERELVIGDNIGTASAGNRNNNHKNNKKSKKQQEEEEKLPDEYAMGFDVRARASQHTATGTAAGAADLLKKEVGLDGDDGMAAAAASRRRVVPQFIAAEDPAVVLVQPIVDVLSDAHAVIAEQVGQLVVMLLLEFDASARTEDSEAENIATLLYMSAESRAGGIISARDGTTGEVLEPLLIAKLVSSFLERIVSHGVHPPADDQKGCDRIAKNVATFMEVLARTHGSLALVAKHAPILMPMLCAEFTDSRKAAISIITELVADRYGSPSHSSWIIAIETVAREQKSHEEQQKKKQQLQMTHQSKIKGEFQSNNTNNDDDNDAAKTATTTTTTEDLHALRPQLVALRDGYLHDLLSRVMDVNIFVRLHTVKQWESLVRRKGVPRSFHLPVIDIAVSRLLDRSHLVRCASLSLLKAAIQANWFGDALSLSQLEKVHLAEQEHLFKRLKAEASRKLRGLAAEEQQQPPDHPQQQQVKTEGHVHDDATNTTTTNTAAVMEFATEDERRQHDQQATQNALNKMSELLAGMRIHLLNNSVENRNLVHQQQQHQQQQRNYQQHQTKRGEDVQGGGDDDDEDDDLVLGASSQLRMQHQQRAAAAMAAAATSRPPVSRHDVWLARVIYLEAALRAAQASELGLRLAVDMLASKTTKDMTDSMHFIVAASGARLDSAPSACEKVLLLIFHHDPSIVNAVCDSFVAVYYSAFEALDRPILVKNVARSQKLVQMLLTASEGTFAAVEKIIETLAARQTTAMGQAQLASAHAAGVLARARGGGALGGSSASSAAANAAGGKFFSRSYYDALWGVCDGSLDQEVTPAARRIALRVYGAFAKCDSDKAEISRRRPDIIRVMQAFPHDNMLVANCFHILAKENIVIAANNNNSSSNLVNNLAPDFDLAVIPVEKEKYSSLARAVKLAVLHCCRATEQCAAWISLAEAATSFLAVSCVAPAFIFAHIVEHVAAELQQIERVAEEQIAMLQRQQQQHQQELASSNSSATAAATVTTSSRVKKEAAVAQQEEDEIDNNNNRVTPRNSGVHGIIVPLGANHNNEQQQQQQLQDNIEKYQILLLNRRSQFFFLLGHSCVKHLVSVEEYERRELQSVSERGAAPAARASGGGELTGRGSEGGRSTQQSTAGTKKAGGAGAAAAGEDDMAKELGLNNSDFLRNKVRDACDRARELTCMADSHPKYKLVSQGVPEQLLVPPVWGKYTPIVELQCRTKFVVTAGALLPQSLLHQQDAAAATAGDDNNKKNKGGGNKKNKNISNTSNEAVPSFGVSLKMYRAMVTHRSQSTLALMKLMAASATFCQKQLPLLFTLLQQADEPWEVKTGIVMGLGDLACTHPNQLLPFMKIASSGFYALLADADVRVRSVAIQICTHLVLNDMLLVGDHVHTIVRLAADPDPTIRHSAEAFCAYLAVKRQKELHNIIPPLVKALSLSEEIGSSSSAAIAAAAAAAAASFTSKNYDKNNNNNKKRSAADDDDDDDDDVDAAKHAEAAAAGAYASNYTNTSSVRRLAPMSEKDFQQAITTLLENVEKGAATDSLITKLCARFTRYNNDDEETVQLNRNLAFCLSELPWTTEREVKRITSDPLFEQYKDWLRDEQVNASFEKIVNKMRRASSGRGAAGAAAATGEDAATANAAASGAGAGGTAAADAVVTSGGGTERRDRILIEEWVSKLSAVAAGLIRRGLVGGAGGAAFAAAATGTDDQQNNDGAAGAETAAATPASGGKGKKAAPKAKGKAAGGKAGGKRRLGDDDTSSSDGDDDSNSGSSSEDDDAAKPAPKAKGKGARAAAKKAAPKRKRASAAADDSSSSSSFSDGDNDRNNNDSAGDDDSDDVPLSSKKVRPAPKAKGKRGKK